LGRAVSSPVTATVRQVAARWETGLLPGLLTAFQTAPALAISSSFDAGTKTTTALVKLLSSWAQVMAIPRPEIVISFFSLTARLMKLLTFPHR